MGVDAAPPPLLSKIFLSFFLKDKTSAPDEFQWLFVHPSRTFGDKFSDGQLLWLRDMT